MRGVATMSVPDAHLELVVDLVAAAGDAGMGNGEIRLRSGLDRLQVHHALLEAERLGCLARSGRTKGTRWWAA